MQLSICVSLLPTMSVTPSNDRRLFLFWLGFLAISEEYFVDVHLLLFWFESRYDCSSILLFGAITSTTTHFSRSTTNSSLTFQALLLNACNGRRSAPIVVVVVVWSLKKNKLYCDVYRPVCCCCHVPSVLIYFAFLGEGRVLVVVRLVYWFVCVFVRIGINR